MNASQTRFFQAIVVVLFLAPIAAGAASFTALGVPSGATDGYALGVSDDGSVVVGALSTRSDPQSSTRPDGFVWTAGAGMVSLGNLTGLTVQQATGVSANGSAVVGTAAFEAFLWTADAGLRGLGAPPGGYSLGTSVSGDGTIVVGSLRPAQGAPQVFRWTSDTGAIAIGNALTGVVSSDGSTIVGQASTPTGTLAYSSTARSGVHQLERQSDHDVALGVSADGSVVVGVMNFGIGNDRPVIWTDGQGVVTLGVLPGTNIAGAGAVSADGSIVVGNSAGGVPTDAYGRGGSKAFVWTAQTGMQSLFDILLAKGATGLDGWHLLDAYDISADGQWVVGRGLNPLGEYEAYRANISTVPIPPVGWLLCPALGFMAWLRRKIVS